MTRCDYCASEILAYLDGSLSEAAVQDFRAHLAECSDCRQLFEEERVLSSMLQDSRPLYSAPAALRVRVSGLAEEALAKAHSVEQDSSASAKNWFWWLPKSIPAARIGKTLIAAVVVVVLGLAFVPEVMQRSRASDYVAAAAEIHQRYVNGTIPLECHTRSPEVVTSWFAGKTPFQFQLPASPAVPDSKAHYWLVGARLVTYNHSPAALVGYETSTEKISLLVASSQSAVVAGGETLQFSSLTFHYRQRAGFEVITWTNHGLAYALVSSPRGSAQHSCLVCHEGIADHIAFQSPQPRNIGH